MIVDPLADFLTRIRNAQMAGSSFVVCPFSKLKYAVAKVMKKNNFLLTVEKETGEDGFDVLRVTFSEKPLQLKRISKPGQRIYVASKELRRVRNGYGIAVVSTPKGVITGYEARALNVGGEFLCTVA